MRGEASRRAMSGGSNISERSELVADSRPYRGNQSSGKGQTQAPMSSADREKLRCTHCGKRRHTKVIGHFPHPMHRDFILDFETQALSISSKGFLVGFVQAIANKQLVELRNLLGVGAFLYASLPPIL